MKSHLILSLKNSLIKTNHKEASLFHFLYLNLNKYLRKTIYNLPIRL